MEWLEKLNEALQYINRIYYNLHKKPLIFVHQMRGFYIYNLLYYYL